MDDIEKIYKACEALNLQIGQIQMRMSDLEAENARLRGAIEEMIDTDHLGFHEGSGEQKCPGGQVVIWINAQDFDNVLRIGRTALKQQGEG